MKKTSKPWGGRFLKETDREVEEFTSSLSFDRRLFRYDIEGSLAHAKMLARQGIITPAEGRQIVRGLQSILRDMEEGKIEFSPQDEDIHMAVERILTERIGSAGGKLHTGRSRNDQIALDLRLYVREKAGQMDQAIGRLLAVLVNLARREEGTILPGYSHLQKAQPILLSHYFLAYREMFNRDRERFRDCRLRANVLPLGAAALAGTGIPLDRAFTARLLSFPQVSKNSLDSVADRDFIAEFLFAASLTMMHLSRLCEDIIIWASDEFKFVEISDAFTTGSSIMPQKKNPDVAELIRGKTGRVYGNLVSILTLLKGLPMSYNRDLQEDKEPLFDTADTIEACLSIMARMLENTTYNRERMFAEAGRGFSTATDMAEYLVMKGIPFRLAHEIVGKIVRHCLDTGKTLTQLTLAELKLFSGEFAEDVFSCLEVAGSVNRKKTEGGTAAEQVSRRLAELEGGSA